eukprot:CAMPEP_0180544968 /NCGR_PEP_ID=MMETSP1036_2-20121128/69791_1 /TAXON_ID=632150 /ORGANISM="Azadinium spinosum, Strain 3D9" /LENGTH=51 /DNA_ID=CAMNT_0022559983 /DNA_START=45 /DNA_END=197 /DNA_ORIENTATION=+
MTEAHLKSSKVSSSAPLRPTDLSHSWFISQRSWSVAIHLSTLATTGKAEKA